MNKVHEGWCIFKFEQEEKYISENALGSRPSVKSLSLFAIFNVFSGIWINLLKMNIISETIALPWCDADTLLQSWRKTHLVVLFTICSEHCF